MDFLHCNRCFQRNPPGGYLISSCFHIFCQTCTKPDHVRCPICDNDVKIVQLNGNISQGVKMYFSNPIKTMKESLEKLQRKIEFQSNIRTHLTKHLAKEKEKKRQMESYFRKKGAEFEAQKKKLAEANAFILTAERKLRIAEEERIRVQAEMEQLQSRLHSTQPAPPPPPASSTPFSFVMSDSHDFGRGSSLVDSLNSTFNMAYSPSSSPALSIDETRNLKNFFDNTEIANAQNPAGIVEESMFANMRNADHPRTALSDTTAFSATFNNMFTPLRNVEIMEPTLRIDKTSVSLDNWRGTTMDISRRETSLPTHNPPTPETRRSAAAPERQQMRDMRRYSSQPGYLAHRKSTSSRNSFLESVMHEND